MVSKHNISNPILDCEGNVLIVEDNSEFAEYLRSRLSSFAPKLKLYFVNSFQTALDWFQATKSKPSIDIALLDVHLPDGRGTGLVEKGLFLEIPVLIMSSDSDIEITGESLMVGASYFINKKDASSDLFPHIIHGLFEQNLLKRELALNRFKETRAKTIQILTQTLRHEINNPLGAVLGASHLIKEDLSTEEKAHYISLIEDSGKRIVKVLDKLCKTVDIEEKEMIYASGETIKIFQVD